MQIKSVSATAKAALGEDSEGVTAVKERPIHDFKELTRGGRPLSRWKFPDIRFVKQAKL
jgi:hypothetical protein